MSGEKRHGALFVDRCFTGGVSLISDNALGRIIYTIFPPFCQVIQSCSQEWKGHNDDDLFDLYLTQDFAVCRLFS